MNFRCRGFRLVTKFGTVDGVATKTIGKVSIDTFLSIN